jgi:sugar O-acyltransferase (sialic acid O-acetyltransferase NeuD family)
MSTLPIIIIGAGGHAKVLMDTLLDQDKDIIGIVDKEASKLGKDLLGIRVIGTDDIVFKYQAEKISLVNGIGSVQQTSLRKNINDQFKQKGYSFANVIHSSAIIAKDVKLGEGVQVMAGVVIQTGSTIGMNTIINTKASIDHDCKIGAHVHIAPGVTISGSVEIGDGAHIGTGAVLIQGIKIGRNSLIGAGSVVIRNVMPETTIIGVPGVVVDKKSEKE